MRQQRDQLKNRPTEDDWQLRPPAAAAPGLKTASGSYN